MGKPLGNFLVITGDINKDVIWLDFIKARSRKEAETEVLELRTMDSNEHLIAGGGVSFTPRDLRRLADNLEKHKRSDEERLNELRAVRAGEKKEV